MSIIKLSVQEGCGRKSRKPKKGKPMYEHKLREGMELGDWSVHLFVQNLKGEINANTTDEEINTIVNEAISRECTYTHTEFQIVWALSVFDWSDFDFNITNMESLASASLSRYMFEDGNISELYDYRDELLMGESLHEDADSKDTIIKIWNSMDRTDDTLVDVITLPGHVSYSKAERIAFDRIKELSGKSVMSSGYDYRII